ncbi:hypothetical protein FGRMN_7023 [Fusarium graminum]|nr:hypothetical protein FGRMN_7023 [Fusarium graminum]
MAALTFAALGELNSQMATLSVPPLASQEGQDECSSECSSECSYYSLADLKDDKWENLELQKAGPWKEYPFCLNKRYIHGSPGPVRIIVNSASNEGYDVVYHPSRYDRSAVLAKYRPKGYAKGVLPKPLPGLSCAGLPSSPTSSTSSLFTAERFYPHYLPPVPTYQPSYYQPVQATYYQPYLHTNPAWTYPMGYSTGYPG